MIRRETNSWFNTYDGLDDRVPLIVQEFIWNLTSAFRNPTRSGLWAGLDTGMDRKNKEDSEATIWFSGLIHSTGNVRKLSSAVIGSVVKAKMTGLFVVFLWRNPDWRFSKTWKFTEKYSPIHVYRKNTREAMKIETFLFGKVILLRRFRLKLTWFASNEQMKTNRKFIMEKFHGKSTNTLSKLPWFILNFEALRSLWWEYWWVRLSWWCQTSKPLLTTLFLRRTRAIVSTNYEKHIRQ